jgi:hypothetical protein
VSERDKFCSHLGGGCSSAVLAYVYFGSLREVELIICGFLHEVIEGVLEHVLDHVDEVSVEEHPLAEYLLVTALDLIETGCDEQLLLVLGGVLVAEGGLLGVGKGLREDLETGRLLVGDVRAHQARRPLLAVEQGLVQLFTLQDLVDRIQNEVVHQGLRFFVFQGQWRFSL